MNFNKNYNCPNCKKQIPIDLKDFIVNTSYENEEKMGTEYEHNVEYEGTCFNCGINYSISGSIWEYPIGAENLDTTTIKLAD